MAYSIVHSGILGMKWGHRNGPPYPLGRSQKSAAEKKAESTGESPNPDSKKYYTPKASEMWEKKDDLSTQELNDFINRINAEQRLKDLVDKENTANKKPQSFIEKALREKAEQTVKAATAAAVTLTVGPLIEKKFGRSIAESVFSDYNKLSPEKKTYKLMDNEALKRNFKNMSNKEIGEQQTRQKLYENIFGTKDSGETKVSDVKSTSDYTDALKFFSNKSDTPASEATTTYYVDLEDLFKNK